MSRGKIVEKGVNTIFQAYSIGVKSGLPTGEIVGYIFMEKKIIQEGFIYCSLRLHNKIPWEKLLYNFPKVSSGIKSGRLTGLFSDQFFLHCYAELRDSITIRSREKIAEIKASVQFSKLFQLESNRVSKEVNSSYSMLLCSCCTASNAVYKFNVLLTFYNCFLYSYEK
jgi:hypothetical protein